MKSYMKLLLFGALVPVVAGCGREAEADDGPSVVTVPVTRADLRITVEATGSVEPVRNVEVKSKASGEILVLHVDVGDYVMPGALLAEVDPRDVRNAFEQAEADLQVAEARMEISEAQLARSEELVQQGVITQQEFETRNLDHANAQAQLVRAQTNFELAELRLGDVQIRAPMAGTIIQRNVEEGTVIQSASQNVSGGTTLFVMANLAAMQVRTLVDETDMGRIQAGLSTEVQVEAFPERRFLGVVQKIEPQAVVQQNVTMFNVIITLDNRDGLLKPGMNAEVVVEIAEAPDVLVVPNNAVVDMTNAGPAMLVLGVDPEQFDLRAMMQEAFSGAPTAAGEAAGGQSAQAGLDSLRALVASGELTQDSMRAIVRSRMASAQSSTGGAPAMGGGQGPARGQRGGGSFGGDRPSGSTASGGNDVAVAFVVDAAGNIGPRVVRTGLSDWDNTQVVSGLEEGENIAVVGAAQLQQSQQEFMNRFRGRSSLFGGR